MELGVGLGDPHGSLLT